MSYALPFFTNGLPSEISRAATQGYAMRSKPGATQTVLRNLPAGTAITLLGQAVEKEGQKWWQVRTADNAVGWVAAQGIIPRYPAGTRVLVNWETRATFFLHSAADDQKRIRPLQPAEGLTLQSGPIYADMNIWWAVLAANAQTGFVEHAALRVGYAAGQTVRVTGGPWNLRSAPDKDNAGNVVAQVQNGQTVTVVGGPLLADGHTWWQVRTAQNQQGYLVGDGLTAV